MKTSELVILLDEDGAEIGTADKATVHTTDTPLHLAFSCHIFNDAGHVLITRRALSKKTWPGVWTNSACGHPGPGESMEGAIRRRAQHELGLELHDITEALPDFRYRAVDASGIVENEICPVFVARATTDPSPLGEEVCEWQWVDPGALHSSVHNTPFAFSPWLVDQMEQWSEPYGFETSVR
ncbi:MAG: isopentenyl-diphosphate Delta-isomerase [Pontimonas sp.]|jgi:isopentenyl-diphosphate Delta-isomerase|nr:isopentenyl-diphosphate Delta-isomerase [Pontimonas sp.]MDP4816095.1 isopentenyl-diphosphate Delta-isomerase [Pontimonas sp.]